MADFKKGDEVGWNTSQGRTHGTVTRKVTGEAQTGGHTAKALPAEPQFEVRSARTGRKAVHKAEALKKV